MIIINVSVASLPIALEPWFYKYGFGFPVYNMAQATRTIIFDTKNHLGLNIGVLLAWVTLSFATMTLLTVLARRRSGRRQTHAGGDVDVEKVEVPGEGKMESEKEKEREREEEERDHEDMEGYMRGKETAERRAEEET